MAQQVEHVLGKDEVTGSNPVSSSKRIGQAKTLALFFWVKIELSATSDLPSTNNIRAHENVLRT